jgi:2-oxoglutarate ferredoxin oxidoreductase subunit delta
MPAKGYVEIDKELCKGCNLCVIHCPTECLGLNTSETNSYGLHFAYQIEEEKCIACMNCGIICPEAAVTVYRMRKRKDAAGGAGAGNQAQPDQGA